MKFNELRSVGHNIADSLAGGIGLMVGVYEIEVFREAAESDEGYIVVDFLSGETDGAEPSAYLANAIRLYAQALPELCRRHGLRRQHFRRLTARFAVDAVYGGHFTVTVEAVDGRRAEDTYVGAPGRRVQRRRTA